MRCGEEKMVCLVVKMFFWLEMLLIVVGRRFWMMVESDFFCGHMITLISSHSLACCSITMIKYWGSRSVNEEAQQTVT